MSLKAIQSHTDAKVFIIITEFNLVECISDTKKETKNSKTTRPDLSPSLSYIYLWMLATY